MAKNRQELELEKYRQLMQPPEVFADGFDWRTVIGALFLGFVMMPGAMYLSLVVGMGGSLTSASQWVTIILFAEVARRSFKDLKMQEIYILYYMAGLAMASPFQSLLWNQFLVQSEFANAMGIAQDIPSWVAPSAEAIREAGRTFFTRAWIAPIALVSVAVIINNIDNFGLGYVLYRLTSDVEELPFPMAPLDAAGIVALSESQDSKEPWRWRYFSIGGMIGMAFGLIYIVLPSVTGSILPKPVMLIPIPFVDFTPSLSQFLPATPINLTIELGLIITGMVLPFWAVIGGGAGLLITMILNPFLYRHGILPNWQPGMDVLDTIYVTNIDFYLAFGIGLTIAVTIISMGQIFKPIMRRIWSSGTAREMSRTELGGKKKPSAWQRLVTNNVKRGDFSIFIALGIYVFSSTFWISLSTWLIDGFPWKFFVFYAVFYTPVISYACAKLEGMVGQAVSLPMVREATYILSGYRGVQIWFAPVPLPNYGRATVGFRVLDLTGTKIKSKIKTQLVTVPVIIVASLLFSQLFWKMADVPSDAYPYIQKMWDLQAKLQCLTLSSTMEGGSLFFEALKFKWLGLGLGIGVLFYAILAALGLPTLFFFGVVRGLGQGPAGIVFEVIGALVGRFYFRRKFGDMWMKYVLVLGAGYSCGMGLVAMVGMAIAILNKMMTPLLF